MEAKTKILAITFIVIAATISLHTKNTGLISPENHPTLYFFLTETESIASLLASSLLIWRGLYFIRANGYRHIYLGNLAFGIFIAVATTSVLFMQKEIGYTTLQAFSFDLSSIKQKEWNALIAQNVYISEGSILEYNGTTFKPNPEDIKLRQKLVAVQQNTDRVILSIYFWIALVLGSVLLGLLWPYNRLPNKAEEPIKNPRADF